MSQDIINIGDIGNPVISINHLHLLLQLQSLHTIPVNQSGNQLRVGINVFRGPRWDSNPGRNKCVSKFSLSAEFSADEQHAPSLGFEPGCILSKAKVIDDCGIDDHGIDDHHFSQLQD